jgi:hypothetical protein
VPGLRTGFPTQTKGRESYFAALPPEDLLPAIPGYPIGKPAAFHEWNLLRRYGPDWRTKTADMEIRRMEAWGLTTGLASWWTGTDPDWKPTKPYLSFFRVPVDEKTSFLGLPDVYSNELARNVDEAAAKQLEPRKNDPFLLGYFVGNEPPWPGREAELVDMILAGPPTATQREAKAYLAQGDTPERRAAFVRHAFEKYLDIINEAFHKHDPNHLNVGMRFGGQPPDYLIKMGRIFDVCSFNPYEYSPTEIMARAYNIMHRPIMFGEFQFGVPAGGLGGSLVQTAKQEERGAAYRYYLEHAAAFPAFVGAGWFVGIDEPVMGAGTTENYNIGFVDVTDRPYPEMVEAAKQTHKRMFALHSGQLPPINRKPKASEQGTPSYHLSDSF